MRSRCRLCYHLHLLQNCFKPPEEPPEPTTGVLNCGKVLPNSSATILAYGRTVEEPAIWMVSRAAFAVVVTAAADTAKAMAMLVKRILFSLIVCKFGVRHLLLSFVLISITALWFYNMTAMLQLCYALVIFAFSYLK